MDDLYGCLRAEAGYSCRFPLKIRLQNDFSMKSVA
jgi:hypothetical protein